MDTPEDRDRTLSRFREGPVLLEQAVRGLNDSELDFKPAGGGWNIRQIIHHITDGDDIWKFGVKMVIGNEQAEFPLEWYSSQTQENWADKWGYSRRSIDVSLSVLKAIREQMLQLMSAVPDMWDRVMLVRTKPGKIETITVGFVFQMQADHLFHHLERIRAILRERRGG